MSESKAIALSEDSLLEDAASGLENVGVDDIAIPL